MVEQQSRSHSPEMQEKPRWQICGEMFADYLSQQVTPRMLFDVDGVLLEPRSLNKPQVSTDLILPAIASLEYQGVEIGLATGRGMHAINYLRKQGGINLSGPNIIEQGHVLMLGDTILHFGHPQHRPFIDSVLKVLKAHKQRRQTFEEVQASAGEFTFCRGKFQWQGGSRVYFWIKDSGDNNRNQRMTEETLIPVIKRVASRYGLDYAKDIGVDVSRVKVGGFAIVGIRGKINNQDVNKGTPLEHFPEGPWIFVADGFGDMPLAVATHDKGGLVVGVRGNLDISNEAEIFLENADIVLDNPEELATALHHAAHLLPMERKKRATPTP